MSNDINLVGGTKKRSLPPQKVALARRISVAVAAITVLIAIIVFLIGLRYSLESAQKNEADSASQLSAYQGKIAKVTLLNDRLVASKRIIATRSEFSVILSTILDKMPSDITPSQLEVEEEHVSVGFTSSSLSSLNDFLNSIVGLTGGDNGISSVVLGSLKYDPGGVYSVQVVIN